MILGHGHVSGILNQLHPIIVMNMLFYKSLLEKNILYVVMNSESEMFICQQVIRLQLYLPPHRLRENSS